MISGPGDGARAGGDSRNVGEGGGRAMRIILATRSPKEADELAQSLLRERLVACANVITAVRAHYWWEGEVGSIR